MSDTGDIAFNVSEHCGYAGCGKALCQGLHGHGFTRTGGTGDQAMSISPYQIEMSCFNAFVAVCARRLIAEQQRIPVISLLVF
jgi:hypothetical protein